MPIYNQKKQQIKVIKKQTNYTLYEAKRTEGLSPVGGFARFLMADLLKRKNKTEIKPRQNTIEEIKNLKELKEKTIFNPIILGQKDDIKKSSTNTKINKLINDGIKIGISLTNIKEENKINENINLLSPRFLSLTENKNKFSNVLSPSLFSLHNEGKGLEKELSLPKLLKSSKINGRDQQEWLNLIMEYSGVNQQIKEIKDSLNFNSNKLENNKEIEKNYENQFKGLYLNRKNIQDIFGDYEERKTSTWEELNKRFNDKQRTDLNQIGYSMLSKDQLKFLYGPKSPFNDSLTLDRLLPLIDSLTINQLIEEDIKKISEMNSFNIRQHDVVLAPSAFRVGLLNPVRASQPFILSPFLFSPTVLSPTIFGVGILSPKLFSPTILSPRVMSPLILNPLMFSPIILSPIVMQPFILSPGLLHATILSPYIMVPFILSPYILAPTILSPSALSPTILSPFAFNPQILSPKAFSGLILSPYAFSPVLWSKTFHYVVILSPSLMS